MPFGISWFWYQIIKVYLEGLLWMIIDMYNVYESKQNKKKKKKNYVFFLPQVASQNQFTGRRF